MGTLGIGGCESCCWAGLMGVDLLGVAMMEFCQHRGGVAGFLRVRHWLYVCKRLVGVVFGAGG